MLTEFVIVICVIAVAQTNTLDSDSGSDLFVNSVSADPQIDLNYSQQDGSSVDNCVRHVFAKGSYPIVLEKNEPEIDSFIPTTITHVRTPVQEKPVIYLPAKIPPPKTISHSYTCYKSILRSHVQDHLITIPTVEHFIETGSSPVVENVEFETFAKPKLNSNTEVLLTPIDASSEVCLSPFQRLVFPQAQATPNTGHESVRPVCAPQTQSIHSQPENSKFNYFSA